MSMMEIKSSLTTRERLVFGLLWIAFFFILGRLATASPLSLQSAAVFTGVCALIFLLVNRSTTLPLRLAGFAIPAGLFAAAVSNKLATAAGAEPAVGQRIAMWAFAVIGLLGGLATLGSLRIGLGIYRAWMHAASPIGWVVSHIVLGIVYFGVFTPIGLAMRLSGRDALLLRMNRSAPSYWQARRQATDPRSYLRQS